MAGAAPEWRAEPPLSQAERRPAAALSTSVDCTVGRLCGRAGGKIGLASRPKRRPRWSGDHGHLRTEKSRARGLPGFPPHGAGAPREMCGTPERRPLASDGDPSGGRRHRPEDGIADLPKIPAYSGLTRLPTRSGTPHLRAAWIMRLRRVFSRGMPAPRHPETT
jgi:hypothetical protein